MNVTRRSSSAADGWRRPRRERVRAIRDRLRELYGRPVNNPHGHPIAELVRTILSQNTNDRNRDVAYERLRAAFPTWVEVRDAPVEEVEEAIRPGGLAPSKAPRIQQVLRELPTTSGASTAARPAPPRRPATSRPSTGSPTPAATRRSITWSSSPGWAARRRPA